MIALILREEKNTAKQKITIAKEVRLGKELKQILDAKRQLIMYYANKYQGMSISNTIERTIMKNKSYGVELEIIRDIHTLS